MEVGVDTVLAIVVAFLLQRLLYSAAATWTTAGGVTVALYTITMGRRYALRRIFEAWNVRQENLPLYCQASSSERLSGNKAFIREDLMSYVGQG